MANPFVGEIRMFAGNFAPLGWAQCDGSLQAISQNFTLFNLIGTTYGGDGQQSFALPDLRGRVPLHQGSGSGLSPRTIGEQGGSETVALVAAQMPQHRHQLQANSALASGAGGPGGVLAATAVNLYGSGPPTVAMAGVALTPLGAGQAHENMAPFVAINYIISLFGVFPSPN